MARLMLILINELSGDTLYVNVEPLLSNAEFDR
ncbi:hypothetical protein SAMN05216175_106169 [Neptunomonas qingdaonensis]|uniref:Uncharacterized protein n=1 Tax=Neptunomonas qingdaonensis TaxID=1045558 RepID=A0A1I2RL09_9GAMM|nr:hypothetical protein SAMN05216175_106169 [Neptunomonas qingdaonensis]